MPKMLWSTVLISILTVTAPARAATCYFYQVDISGQAIDAGTQQFSVNEWVVLRDLGVTDPQTLQSNRFEVFITNFPNQVFGTNGSADIKADPYPVGSIELMTNSIYANNRGVRASQQHLADVFASNFQNPPGLLVQFRLNGQGIIGQTDPGGLQLSPNAVKVPGPGAFVGGLPFLPGGGLGSLTNFFGAFSPGSAGISVIQTYVLVPNQGFGYLFLPNANPSSIQGGIQISAVQPDNFNNKGQYLGNFQGRFNASFQCQ
jgi:hypothetical protein